MPVSSQFEQWSLGYSGCDGGDAGSASARSVWVCGIEWGGGHTPEGLREQIGECVDLPRGGYDDWKENISYIFNWQAMKLLAVINGYELSKYKQFASDTKPFVQGASGYFKMNLYPIAFRSTSREHWLRDFAEITGFSTKDEYVAWCNERRLPKISEWARFHAPKMIICLGKTFRSKFGSAFLVGQGPAIRSGVDFRRDVPRFDQAFQRRIDRVGLTGIGCLHAVSACMAWSWMKSRGQNWMEINIRWKRGGRCVTAWAVGELMWLAAMRAGSQRSVEFL